MSRHVWTICIPLPIEIAHTALKENTMNYNYLGTDKLHDCCRCGVVVLCVDATAL